jgi:mRNA interferase RelE/StbE
MEVVYSNSFFKAVKKIKNEELLEKIELAILNVKSAKSTIDISNIKKIVGHKSYYRIRIGEYRIGIEIIEEIVDFIQFEHRKDIYKKFP